MCMCVCTEKNDKYTLHKQQQQEWCMKSEEHDMDGSILSLAFSWMCILSTAQLKIINQKQNNIYFLVGIRLFKTREDMTRLNKNCVTWKATEVKESEWEQVRAQKAEQIPNENEYKQAVCTQNIDEKHKVRE